MRAFLANCQSKTEYANEARAVIGFITETDGSFLYITDERMMLLSEHSPLCTADEMDIARQTDLPDLLTSLGYQVKP